MQHKDNLLYNRYYRDMLPILNTDHIHSAETCCRQHMKALSTPDITAAPGIIKYSPLLQNT